MASFTTTNFITDDTSWTNFFEPDDPARIGTHGATSFRWTNPDGTVVTLTGTGFSYNGATPLTGRVTGLTVTNGSGQTVLSATGLNADLQALFTYAFGEDPDGGSHKPANGFTFLSYLMLGGDLHTGSDQDDYFSGGNDRGNDTVNAGGGNDYIAAYAGKDVIDGGAGTDTLSYQGSSDDSTSLHGINVNVAAGTVKDCWNATDTFTGIERFRGSKFADTFKGDATDNAFMGLRGNDSFTGGAGFDELAYYRDGTEGGSGGITASFAAGTVIDGFGNTDTFAGFEFIIGTRFADSFIGDDKDNTFAGTSGKDSYNGGAGADVIDFSVNALPAITGANVNLTRANDQIQNDGFGNVETAVAIEHLYGTDFADTFVGNSTANQLRGEKGNDTISGGLGKDTIWGDGGADVLTGGPPQSIDADTFVYSRHGGVDPWGDTITDFNIFHDHISIYVPDFAGMTLVRNVTNSPNAQGEGSWFFYDFTTHGLYWDRDGIASQFAPILLVTLTGVDGIRPQDIVLFD